MAGGLVVTLVHAVYAVLRRQEVQGGSDGLKTTAGRAGLAATPAVTWHCLQLCAAQFCLLHHAGSHQGASNTMVVLVLYPLQVAWSHEGLVMRASVTFAPDLVELTKQLGVLQSS